MTPSTSSSLTYLRPEVQQLKDVLDDFIENDVIPAEDEWHAHINQFQGADRFQMKAIPPVLFKLQETAKQLGLWNLFLPERLIQYIPDNCQHLLPKIILTYREYGLFCESMGRSIELAPLVCNCSAPDTGNMEVLLEFGSDHLKQQYLEPLLNGSIRSTFLMTEPRVASSDPTNLETSLTKEPDGTYTLRGEKWWSTGAMDPRCQVAIVVAKNCTTTTKTSTTTNRHHQHCIVVLPLPHPGFTNLRPLTVFGYDDAPFGHAHVKFEISGLTHQHILNGSGFAIAQARLGPGRIHHCMRAIGVTQRCYDLMLERSCARVAFGKLLHEHGMTQAMIATSCYELQAARLLTLDCAAQLDQVQTDGTKSKQARSAIAAIKVAIPKWCCDILDRAIQIHGGAGVCDDLILAKCWAGLRTLKIADGPDAVHLQTLSKLQVQEYLQNKKNKNDKSRL